MSEYKRITSMGPKGRCVAEAGFYGVYLDCDNKRDMIFGDLVDRLSELEDMTEKIGKHCLPVGIGDIVYYVCFYGGYIELQISKIIFSQNDVAFVGKSASEREIMFYLSAFDTNVVRTESEAQKLSEAWSR